MLFTNPAYLRHPGSTQDDHHSLLLRLHGDEGHGGAPVANPPGAADPMDIGGDLLGSIVVDHEAHLGPVSGPVQTGSDRPRHGWRWMWC